MKEEGRAREAAYTVFHPLVVGVLFVLFLTQPAGIVQKQKNTKRLPQADERRCNESCVSPEARELLLGGRGLLLPDDGVAVHVLLAEGVRNQARNLAHVVQDRALQKRDSAAGGK